MGHAMSIWHWLIVVVIVALVFGTRRFTRLEDDMSRLQLHKDVARMPVYSAETTSGKEAEFIRDRLPRRIPKLLILALAVILCAVAWWLVP
jgi:hypothetical protein